MTNMSAAPLKDRLVVGKLLKSRGLAGELGIFPYADDLSRFSRLRVCQLESEDGKALRQLTVNHVSVSGSKVFLRFEGVNTREEAEKLTGFYLSVPRSEAVPLDEDSWYVTDLLSCHVFDEKRGDLGILTEVVGNSANDLLRVCRENENDLYIPFRKALLDSVDPVKGEIRLRLPDGLYELYRGRE